MVKKTPVSFRAIALQAAVSADEKHGEDIVLFNIRRLTPIADYMLIITANSSPHARALAEEIERVLSRQGIQLLHRDGRYSGTWMVLDYGGMVIHIMQHETREFYGLEKLWHDARRVRWSKKQFARN